MKKTTYGIEVALLLLLLVIAAYLRFTNLDTTWIGGDQSGLLSVAMEFVTEGKIPLAANKSSAGIINPPLVEYLYAIPLSMTRRIIAVAWFTAAANLVSVALCYAFSRRFFGVRVALVATLLYAVSPWAVSFSRMIWNPTMLPLFSTCALGCLIAYLTEQKPGWLIGSFLALAGVVQLHWASVVLLGVVGLCGLVFHRRLKVWPLVIGGAVFALTFIPYLIYERSVGFQNTAALLQAEDGEAQISLAPALIASDLASAQGFDKAGRPWSALNAMMRAAVWGGVMYLGVTALRHIGKAWRGNLSSGWTARLLLVLWTVVPIAVYLRQTHYLQHHYFLYLYPALQIIIAILVDDAFLLLWKSGGRVAARAGRWAIRGASLLLPVALLIVVGYYFRLLQIRVLPENQAACVQLRHFEAAITQTQTLLDDTGSHDLIVLSEGTDADHSKLGLLRHFVEPGTRLRYIRLDDGLSIPQGPGVYLVAGYSRRAMSMLDVIAQKRGEIVLSCETWTFYTISGMSTIGASPEPIGVWENGLRLSEYQVQGRHCPGREVKLVMYFDVGDGAYDQGQVHFFNHLMSADGNLASQYDGIGIHNMYWFPGDRLINWFVIPLPPDLPLGRYDVYIGMYTWPDRTRVGLLSEGSVDDRLFLTSVEVEGCEK